MSGHNAPADGSYDAWMGRALLAFPPRWRDEHGAELIDVGRELSVSDGSQRPSLRELADVVRGGLVVRFRDRPPSWHRMRYHWFSKPVPRRYWGWMRDDLRGRFLGLRINLRSLVGSLAIYGAFRLISGALDGLGVAVFAAFVLLIAIINAPAQGRRFRSRIHQRIGFDLASWDVLPLGEGTEIPFPTLPAAPSRPAAGVPMPAERLPIRQFVWPFTCWGLLAGAALLVGAALPNTSFSSGPFSYAPDPNSPLTAAEVGSWSAALAAVATLLIGAVLVIGRFRSRRLTGVTAHPVNAFNLETRRSLWGLVSLAAVPALAIGLSGMLPDLACVTVGSGLVLAGAGLVGLGLVARLVEPGLGRPLSVPDLTVGERWQRRWGHLAEVLPA